MYNDHGIMPSEIMQALSNAYKQKEQNSRQNIKAKVESFFTALTKTQVEFMSLTDMPLDVREVVSKINKMLNDWQYNIACIFDSKVEVSSSATISNNLFCAVASIHECIGYLADLIDNKNCKQVLAYIQQGNILVGELMSVLSKKSIAIRRYF